MRERLRKVMEFWRCEFVVGEFAGFGGLRLQYARRAVAGQVALVVVSGRTEFMEKYGEIFHDLLDASVAFYIYDHRGQGGSERLLADCQKGHVDVFNNYVSDLEIFLESVVRPDRPRKIIILSHSMGGAISLLYARKHAGCLDGLILSSPMCSVNTRPFPLFLARAITRVAILAGMEADYVIGGGPWRSDLPFEKNFLTGNRSRFEHNLELVRKKPALALGGPTFGWLDQSFAMLENLLREQCVVPLPVLLLQGGADRVVGQREQLKISEVLADCRLVCYSDGRHELLMEDDHIRSAALREICSFLERVAG